MNSWWPALPAVAIFMLASAVWYNRGFGDTQEFILSDPDSGKIIVVFETFDVDSDEEHLQIIRSLHAVPDMLEALEAWEQVIGIDEDELSDEEFVQFIKDSNIAVELTRKALKKARGEE